MAQTNQDRFYKIVNQVRTKCVWFRGDYTFCTVILFERKDVIPTIGCIQEYIPHPSPTTECTREEFKEVFLKAQERQRDLTYMYEKNL